MLKHLVACVIVVLFGLLANRETSDDPLLASFTVTVKGNATFIFDMFTTFEHMPMLFPLFRNVTPVDKRPWSTGKLFEAVIAVPLVGRFDSHFRVTEYQPETSLEFEGDMLVRPRMVVKLKDHPERKQRTIVNLDIFARSRSYLFQLTAKQILSFIIYHNWKQRLFIIQYFFQDIP